MTKPEIAHRAKELLVAGLRLEITPEEIVITRHGKAVARLVMP
jgi:hypothetical protein